MMCPRMDRRVRIYSYPKHDLQSVFIDRFFVVIVAVFLANAVFVQCVKIKWKRISSIMGRGSVSHYCRFVGAHHLHHVLVFFVGPFLGIPLASCLLHLRMRPDRYHRFCVVLCFRWLLFMSKWYLKIIPYCVCSSDQHSFFVLCLYRWVWLVCLVLYFFGRIFFLDCGVFCLYSNENWIIVPVFSDWYFSPANLFFNPTAQPIDERTRIVALVILVLLFAMLFFLLNIFSVSSTHLIHQRSRTIALMVLRILSVLLHFFIAIFFHVCGVSIDRRARAFALIILSTFSVLLNVSSQHFSRSFGVYHSPGK